MSNDPLLARLAAANPVPDGPRPHALPAPARRRRVRRPVLALAAAAAIAVPAVAFAGDLGSLLGLSNQGATVDGTQLPASGDTVLAQGMESLSWPAQSRLLATRDGISVYVSRRADGGLCVEIGPAGSGGPGTMIGCLPPDLAAKAAIAGMPVTDGTDRPKTPRLVSEFAGVAVDGIAHVDLVGADGTTLASAPVTDNVYVGRPPSQPVAAVVAYDGNGDEVYRTTVGPLPNAR